MKESPNYQQGHWRQNESLIKDHEEAGAPMARYAQVMTQWHDGTFGSKGKSREGIPNTQITVMKRIPDA